MQHEARTWCAIECVAHNGRIQAATVGGVHTQLMGAARERIEPHLCESITALHHLISGYRLLALRLIHHLKRPVLKVGPQRQTNGARIFLDKDFVGYPLRKDFTHPEMIRRPV